MPVKKMTAAQLKRKLKERTKDELLELLLEAVTDHKQLHSYLAVKLQGEDYALELLESCKEEIRKQFYPSRGMPKLKVDKVEQTLSEMRAAGAGTAWPFELLVYFCETAAQFIEDYADIFENMGDLLTDSFETVIQELNKDESAERYEAYKDRLKVIMMRDNLFCWGIHDSLIGSYFELKWLGEDEKTEVLKKTKLSSDWANEWDDLDDDDDEEDDEDGEVDDDDIELWMTRQIDTLVEKMGMPKEATSPQESMKSTVVSYEAMRRWLSIPAEVRQKLLHSVWCSACSKGTSLSDYSVSQDKHGIVLNGHCAVCGGKAVQLIEV
ncbi:hypothetical protein [Paenibacillus sp. YYML68]|uniref:hypothetical protein n=1 Tax=Paenibacillus sp. YYML68 TaxID=2909250 RepID=UPI0024928350|nr:hypothetical protein [Paenibacillus sp. YYML68]